MLVEVFSKFGKYNSQNLLLPDFENVGRLPVVMPVNNGSSERSFPKIKDVSFMCTWKRYTK